MLTAAVCDGRSPGADMNKSHQTELIPLDLEIDDIDEESGPQPSRSRSEIVIRDAPTFYEALGLPRHIPVPPIYPYALTPELAQQILEEELESDELILRIIEAEPMGIERLASLIGIKTALLRLTIRRLEASGRLETRRDRLMLGPAHDVSLPCSETAMQMIVAAFIRNQDTRQELVRRSGLSEEIARQALKALQDNGVIRSHFIGAIAIYELIGSVSKAQEGLSAAVQPRKVWR